MRWCGADVPEGHENDNPLVLTADRAKTVYPYFRTKWTLASGKMCDGHWKFTGSTQWLCTWKPPKLYAPLVLTVR